VDLDLKEYRITSGDYRDSAALVAAQIGEAMYRKNAVKP
jgi:hypothetical protein